HVIRWAKQIAKRPAVQRGRMVNRTWGDKGPQLAERHSAADIAVTGRVIVTELSGSESSAHFEVNGRPWVSLAHGVHPFQLGEEHTFYMDPSHGFIFAGEAA
ncbi:MAG: hypothetical protein AAGL96_17710, partial [Pseudomonadota bacterium]